jgi:ribonuclease BN (tRNA processing enzyme)
MEIRFLGAHNTESRDTRLSGLLVDSRLALDAGSITASLSIEEQLKLEAVLITHSHYDHTKDLPLLAMNFYLNQKSFDVYVASVVAELLADKLFSGELYPKFLEQPEDVSTINIKTIFPNKILSLAGYEVLPVLVNHAELAFGYQITDINGKTFFYTGDTGPGLSECWKVISPQLLIIEVTVPNRFRDFAIEKNHLTPGLLNEELLVFQKFKGYLPEVAVVHMNPALQAELATELREVATLGCSITTVKEGLKLRL